MVAGGVICEVGWAFRGPREARKNRESQVIEGEQGDGVGGVG